MSRRNPIGDTTIHAAGRQLRAISGSREKDAASPAVAGAAPRLYRKEWRAERSRTPNPQITNRAAERLHRAETQRRDRPPEAQPQQAFDHSRSSCPTNDPYNSAPSLPQLNLSHRIATSSASARAEGCAWRARRGVPGFSPRGTPARACRWAFLITGRFVTQR